MTSSIVENVRDVAAADGQGPEVVRCDHCMSAVFKMQTQTLNSLLRSFLPQELRYKSRTAQSLDCKE